MLELGGHIGSRARGLFVGAPGVGAEEVVELASGRDLWGGLVPVEFAHSPAAQLFRGSELAQSNNNRARALELGRLMLS